MAKANLKAIHQRLMKAAAAYPEAYKDSPWGETVYKVNKKVFVFFGVPGEGSIGLSVKLPDSADAALMLPFAESTGYGLGKAGWVTASFEASDKVPEGLLLEWIEESYRAVAPKKLVKQVEGAAPGKPKAKRGR